MRPHFYSPAFGAVAGWVATGRSARGSSFWCVILGVALLAGASQIINDWADREKDAVTAPYLPIPAGLISPTLAGWACGLILVLALILIGIGTPGVSARLMAFSVVIGIAACVYLYSAIKHMGPIASVFIALPYTAPAALGWIAGGGGWNRVIALLLCDFFLTMLFSNTFAAIRDLDRDGEVGNRTLPAMIGARAAFVISGALLVVSLCVTVSVFVAAGGSSLKIVLVGMLAIWLVFWLIRIYPTLEERSRGRAQRSLDLVPIFRANIWRVCLLVYAFSPSAALVTFCACEVLSSAQRYGYSRRVLSGRLAMSMRS
jgi:4-hydroxybenzoate polyprenyltransferase